MAISNVDLGLFQRPHGPLVSYYMMGTEGVVIERKEAKARMVLEVTILGQGTVVEIDSDLLEPME